MQTTLSPKFDPDLEIARANARIQLKIDRMAREACRRIDMGIHERAMKRSARNTLAKLMEMRDEANKTVELMEALVKSLSVPYNRTKRFRTRKVS